MSFFFSTLLLKCVFLLLFLPAQSQTSKTIEIFSNSEGEIQKQGDHYGFVQAHHNRSIVAGFGRFGVNVSVQINPILVVAIQSK